MQPRNKLQNIVNFLSVQKILFDNSREHEQPPRTKDYIYKFLAEKVKEKVFLVLTNMISYI